MMSILLFILGIVIVLASILGYRQATHRNNQWIKVSGTVVEHKVKSMSGANGEGSEKYYFPVINYQINGKAYSHNSNVGTTKHLKKSDGSTIMLRCNPENPNEIVEPSSNVAALITTVIFSADGVVLTLWSIVRLVTDFTL